MRSFLKIDLIVSPLTLRKVKESYFLLSVASKKMFFKFSSIASSFKLQSSVTSSASASINQLTNYKLIWFKIRKKKIQKKPILIALPFILFDDFPPPDWLGHTFSLSSLSQFINSSTVSKSYGFLSEVSMWFLVWRKWLSLLLKFFPQVWQRKESAPCVDCWFQSKFQCRVNIFPQTSAANLSAGIFFVFKSINICCAKFVHVIKHCLLIFILLVKYASVYLSRNPL